MLLVLDPNADFRLVSLVKPAELWTQASYNSSKRLGELPHEASREVFSGQWSTIAMRILRGSGAARGKGGEERLRLWWPALDVAFLFGELDSMLRSQLYHCHRFAQAIGYLTGFKTWSEPEQSDPVNEAERFYRMWRKPAGVKFSDLLKKEFDVKKMVGRLDSMDDAKLNVLGVAYDLLRSGVPSAMEIAREEAKGKISRWLDLADRALDYVSEDAGSFYFAKAREYADSNILEPSPAVARERVERLTVLDLASFESQETRLLSINVALNDLWTQARREWRIATMRTRIAARRKRLQMKDERVPTFVVVDEAHHLAPSEPQGVAERTLREQFRTIAAEGRKYGIFLILASQRPDKLDPFVLSECENKAIMKLNSEPVLNMAQGTLGLDDIQRSILRKCLECGTGRVLLLGQWASDGPQWLHCAARRTVESGRSLSHEHWAVPPD